MQGIEWMKVLRNMVGLALTIIVLWIFTSIVWSYFANGTVVRLWLDAFYWIGVIVASFYFLLPASSLRTALLIGPAVFILFLTIRGTMIHYNESGVDSMDQSLSGAIFEIGKKVYYPFLNNDQISLEYDKQCDKATAAYRQQEEKEAVDKYASDGNIAVYITTRAAINKKYEAVKGCKTEPVTPSNTTADDSQSNSASVGITVPATTDQWVAICTEDCSLSVTGEVDYGGETATPDHSPRMGDLTAKACGLPFGVLIAKVGESGKPFKVGSQSQIKSGGKTVYVVVNDSYYGDNHGSYKVSKGI
jgi:hypothetical protein